MDALSGKVVFSGSLRSLVATVTDKPSKSKLGRFRERSSFALTLVTKILLGTLGCIPAYDRYFIDGMRKSGISYSRLSLSNLTSVVEFFKKYQAEFFGAQEDIYSQTNIRYPAMKLLDMYFWEIGFRAAN